MSASAKTLAKTLRKHLEEPSSFEIPADGAPGRWLAGLGLGRRLGKALRLDRHEAAKARMMLLKGMEANDFSVLDAMPATRSQALSNTRNEKLHGSRPRGMRVAVKAFPGHPLLCDGHEIWLSPSDNLDIDAGSIVRFSAHSVVVAVENWESFERLPNLDADICSRLPPSCSPLAIWRGSIEYPVGTALRAMSLLAKPCYAYVDFDPAGLSIAQSLPKFVDMLAPSQTELERLFSSQGRPKLFVDQAMPKAPTTVQASNWSLVFHLCNRFAAGFPQEHFQAQSPHLPIWTQSPF